MLTSQGEEIACEKTAGDTFPERPRRGKRLPYTKRSLYVSKVQKIKIHAINSEEDAIWDWLFDNKKNK